MADPKRIASLSGIKRPDGFWTTDGYFHTLWENSTRETAISVHDDKPDEFVPGCPYCDQGKEYAESFPKDTAIRNAWTIDIEKWFGLRTPNDEQKIKLDMIRAQYMHLADSIIEHCPQNPDRTHAIRQLKESMQTAISSIVCADTWGLDDLEVPETTESDAS